MSEYQNFLNFCYQNGYLQKHQIEQISRLPQGSASNFLRALTQITNFSPEQIQNLQMLYSKSRTTGTFQRANTEKIEQIRIPAKVKECFIFAQEIFGLGLVPLKQLNTCMVECCREGEDRNILQYMLAKRLISTKDFIFAQKSSDPNKWKDTASALEIRNNGAIFYLEKKSTIKKIGHYNIIRELGRGGMGVVYEAEDINLKRTVAIKTMISDLAGETQHERFVREAQLVASLKHPSIVNVYEIGQENSTIYFVMDYIEGVSLVEYIQMMKLNLHEKVKLFVKVAEGLVYAHKQNIIHRDIKPDNIIVDAQGNPYLMDFGLAKQTQTKDSLTMTGDALGTPQYMSPEQVEGRKSQIRHSTDIYSLGAVLYQVLTGRPPFTANSMQALFIAIVAKEPIPPRKLVDGLPIDIETICLKCLEKKAETRYPDVNALIQDFNNFLVGEPISARPLNSFVKLQRIIKRHKTLCASIAAIFITLLTFVYFFFLAPGYVQLSITGRINGKIQEIESFISVNDKKIPTAKTYSISSGYHNIKIEAPEFESLEILLDVKPGKEIKIEKELSRISGKITISVNVPDVKIICQNINSSEIIEFFAPVYEYQLPIGNYSILAKKENYFSQEYKTKIQHNKTSELSLKMESMKVWEYKFDNITDVVSVHDVDMDGEVEIYAVLRNGQLISYDAKTRQVIWKFDQKVGTRIHYQLEFRDVNRDGYDDIIYANASDFHIIDGLTHQVFFRVNSWWGGQYVFHDFDDDGYDEVILCNRFRGIRCYDSKTNETLWHVPVDTLDPFDGKPFFLDKNTLLYRANGKIQILNCLTKQRALKLQNNHYDSFFYLKEIGQILMGEVGGFSSYDPVTFRKLWHFSANKNISCPGFLIYDIDGDNQKEILIQSNDLYCLDTQGNLKWSFSTEAKRKTIVPIVTDFDKDGQIEIVTGSDNRGYVLDNTGKLRNQFSLSANIENIFIADTTGDGFVNAICHAGQYLYAITPFLSPFRKEFSTYFFGKTQFLDIDSNQTQDILVPEHNKIISFNATDFQKNKEISIPNEELINYLKVEENKKVTCITPKKIYIIHNNEIIYSCPHDIMEIQQIQTEDLDDDGFPEVFFTLNRTDLLCFSTKEKQRKWLTNINVRNGKYSFLDCNNDGVKDIIGLDESRDDFYFSRIHCLSGTNGRHLWQGTTLRPGDSSIGCSINYFADKTFLFACQIAGAFSRIDHESGRVTWHKQLDTNAILPKTFVGNYGNSNHTSVIVMSEDGDVYSLNIKTGETLWHHHIENSNNNRIATGCMLKIENKDIILITFDPYEFYAIDAETGNWVGNTNLQVFQKTPDITTINNDDFVDFIGISEEDKTVQILNLPEYIRKSFLPNFVIHHKQKNIEILKLHKIAQEKSYELFSETLLNQKAYITDFYQAIAYCQQKKYTSALISIKTYLQKCPNSFRGKFIQLLILLNLYDENANNEVFYLIEKSLYSFDNHMQEYHMLLSNEAKAYLKQLLSSVIQKNKYFEVLPNLYKNSLLMNVNNEKILTLSLKYTIPKYDSTYENRKKIYIDSVLATIDQLRTLYVRARGYSILEEALQVLPEEPILLFEKAMIDFERRNYDIAQQLFEQVTQKQNSHMQAIIGNVICLLIQRQNSIAETFLQKSKPHFVNHKEMYLLLEALIKKQFQEVVIAWKKIVENQEMAGLFGVWSNSINFIMVTQK